MEGTTFSILMFVLGLVFGIIILLLANYFKNKIAPPFKIANVDIMYGQGISKEGELVDLASEIGVIEKSGAWYAYKGEKIGQGKENVKLYLRENPSLCEEVLKKVKVHYGLIDDNEKGKNKEKSVKTEK